MLAATRGRCRPHAAEGWDPGDARPHTPSGRHCGPRSCTACPFSGLRGQGGDWGHSSQPQAPGSPLGPLWPPTPPSSATPGQQASRPGVTHTALLRSRSCPGPHVRAKPLGGACRTLAQAGRLFCLTPGGVSSAPEPSQMQGLRGPGAPARVTPASPKTVPSRPKPATSRRQASPGWPHLAQGSVGPPAGGQGK